MSKLKRSKKSFFEVPLLPKKNDSKLNKVESDYLKFMNMKDVKDLFFEIDKIDLQIIGLSFDFINSENVADTFDDSIKPLFLMIYKDTPFIPERNIVKIKEIIFSDKLVKNLESPLYFFKSSGESRKLNDKLKTKDIWFPTNKNPLEMDFTRVTRITKLEDPILASNIRPKDPSINIMKYGRFLTLENSLISKFLFDTLK